MEKNHLEMILESIDSKFQLVLEGHDSLRAEMQTMGRELNEKIDEVRFELGIVNKKVDAVAAELGAHRADTEAHHGVYRVKEPGA